MLAVAMVIVMVMVVGSRRDLDGSIAGKTLVLRKLDGFGAHKRIYTNP